MGEAVVVFLRKANRLAGGDGVGPLREDDNEVVDDREEEHLEEAPDVDSEKMDAMLPRSRPVLRRRPRFWDLDRRFGRGRCIGSGRFFRLNSDEQSNSSGFERMLRVS